VGAEQQRLLVSRREVLDAQLSALPAAHLALMRREMVVRRLWLSEQEFLDLLGVASALPGPTSTQVGLLQ